MKQTLLAACRVFFCRWSPCTMSLCFLPCSHRKVSARKNKTLRGLTCCLFRNSLKKDSHHSQIPRSRNSGILAILLSMYTHVQNPQAMILSVLFYSCTSWIILGHLHNKLTVMCGTRHTYKFSIDFSTKRPSSLGKRQDFQQIAP